MCATAELRAHNHIYVLLCARYLGLLLGQYGIYYMCIFVYGIYDMCIYVCRGAHASQRGGSTCVVCARIIITAWVGVAYICDVACASHL